MPQSPKTSDRCAAKRSARRKIVTLDGKILRPREISDLIHMVQGAGRGDPAPLASLMLPR